MEEWAKLAAQGSPLALLAFLIIGGKYLFEAIAASRKAKNEGAPTPLRDAATVNEMLRSALKDEREENVAKSARIDALEDEVDRLRERGIRYEREIAELRKQLDQFARKIDSLQGEIRRDNKK